MSRWGSNKISPENVRITSQPNYRGGGQKGYHIVKQSQNVASQYSCIPKRGSSAKNVDTRKTHSLMPSQLAPIPTESTPAIERMWLMWPENMCLPSNYLKPFNFTLHTFFKFIHVIKCYKIELLLITSLSVEWLLHVRKQEKKFTITRPFFSAWNLEHFLGISSIFQI